MAATPILNVGRLLPQESCQAMSPSSWFGQGSSVGGTHPSPVAYHGLYALTVRWQSPAPRGDLHRKSLATCIPEPSLLPKGAYTYQCPHSQRFCKPL